MHGPFQLGMGYELKDFTDGLSHTLLIGEKHVPPGMEGVGWWDCSIYNGGFYQCSTRAVSRLVRTSASAFRLSRSPRARSSSGVRRECRPRPPQM